jgi:hypothetical protein
MDFSQVVFYYTFKSYHYWAERAYSVVFKRKNDKVHMLVQADCEIHLGIKYSSKVEVKSWQLKVFLDDCIYLFIFG